MNSGENIVPSVSPAMTTFGTVKTQSDSSKTIACGRNSPLPSLQRLIMSSGPLLISDSPSHGAHALALGSKNTGIEDAIVNKKTGILADPFSINEIIDGIDLILQKRDEFSKNVINWALEHSWSNISNQYLKAIINA